MNYTEEVLQDEINKAKQLLDDNGYAVGSLWSIADVQSRFKCDNDQAKEIIEMATGNDWIIEQINVTISDWCSNEGLEENEDY